MDARLEGGNTMKLERLSVEEALRRGQALPWALVRSLGGMSLENSVQ